DCKGTGGRRPENRHPPRQCSERTRPAWLGSSDPPPAGVRVPRAAQQEDTVESQRQSRGQTPAVGPASNGSRASSSCLSGPRRRHIPRAFRRFLERYEGDLWRTLIDQEILDHDKQILSDEASSPAG